MIGSEKSLEEILNALFEKAGNLDELKNKEELKRLKSEPGFRRLVEVQARNPKPIRNLAVIYSEEHKRHYSDQFKWESPSRVEAILTTLKSQGFFRETKSTLLKARKATIEELQSVHDLKYIEFIRDTSLKGVTNLPRSTYICPGTWDAALYAAGGALMAGEVVEKQGAGSREQGAGSVERRKNEW